MPRLIRTGRLADLPSQDTTTEDLRLLSNPRLLCRCIVLSGCMAFGEGQPVAMNLPAAGCRVIRNKSVGSSTLPIDCTGRDWASKIRVCPKATPFIVRLAISVSSLQVRASALTLRRGVLSKAPLNSTGASSSTSRLGGSTSSTISPPDYTCTCIWGYSGGFAAGVARFRPYRVRCGCACEVMRRG